MPEYDSASIGSYQEPMYNEHSFLEVDEEEPYEAPAYKSNYSASDSKVRYDEDEKPKPKVGQTVRSADSFLNDNLPEYSHPEEGSRYVGGSSRKERPRRRRSKEMIESTDLPVSSNEDEPTKRKPETMRSISEDVPPRTVKPVTRRSLSHPEKDMQVKLHHIPYRLSILIHLHSDFYSKPQSEMIYRKFQAQSRSQTYWSDPNAKNLRKSHRPDEKPTNRLISRTFHHQVSFHLNAYYMYFVCEQLMARNIIIFSNYV